VVHKVETNIHNTLHNLFIKATIGLVQIKFILGIYRLIVSAAYEKLVNHSLSNLKNFLGVTCSIQCIRYAGVKSDRCYDEALVANGI
jgi:hypothetical protein